MRLLNFKVYKLLFIKFIWLVNGNFVRNYIISIQAEGYNCYWNYILGIYKFNKRFEGKINYYI